MRPITGYRLNGSELTFCRKSSLNISIDIRYCNRFIHLDEPIFSVNHNGASLCLQSRPHLESCMRMSMLHSWGTGHPICDLSRIIATRQLDALTVPSTHYVSNNCVYFQSYLLAGTNSIVIDLMTTKDLTVFSASANLPFLLGWCDCRWLRSD